MYVKSPLDLVDRRLVDITIDEATDGVFKTRVATDCGFLISGSFWFSSSDDDSSDDESSLASKSLALAEKSPSDSDS